MVATSIDITLQNCPGSTVAIIDIAYLGEQLKLRNHNAMTLKVFLESSPITKVFWDARGLAKKLYEDHDIILDHKVVHVSNVTLSVSINQ